MWCAHHLVPGLFVGQVGEGDWRYPFLFQVPLSDRAKTEFVSDQEADASRNVFGKPKQLATGQYMNAFEV